MNTSFVVLQIDGSADASKSSSEYPMCMDKNIIIVVIATSSNPLADGLEALLRAVPQIDEVRITRNLVDVNQQIETGRIRIVLIDSSLLGSNPQAHLEQIQSLSPQTRRVLLVDDVQEVSLMPRHAEAILIKGAAPSAVATVVTNLLLEEGEDDERNISS